MASRKLYIAVATELKPLVETSDDVEKSLLTSVVCRLSNVFKADNPAFDVSRFMSACGIEKGE